jgi:hypothetical protein
MNLDQIIVALDNSLRTVFAPAYSAELIERAWNEYFR